MTDQLEQAIETAWDDRATITSATGGAVREAETFRLMWSLDAQDLPALED